MMIRGQRPHAFMSDPVAGASKSASARPSPADADRRDRRGLVKLGMYFAIVALIFATADLYARVSRLDASLELLRITGNLEARRLMAADQVAQGAAPELLAIDLPLAAPLAIGGFRPAAAR